MGYSLHNADWAQFYMLLEKDSRMMIIFRIVLHESHQHTLNRSLLYLWRETHFVIKTYILFEPTDPNSIFLFILVYKSNAFQSVWITILQIITTQKKFHSLFTLQTQ